MYDYKSGEIFQLILEANTNEINNSVSMIPAASVKGS